MNSSITIEPFARNLRDGPWYWAPRAVIQEKGKEVGFLALAVYHVLASMVDASQRCFPSQTLLARTLGCSRTSVTGAVKRLEAYGLIQVIRQNRSQNMYTLLKVSSMSDRHQMSGDRPHLVNGDDTNDIRLSKIDTYERTVSILNIDRKGTPEGGSREEVLASDLALALNEPDRIPLYLSLATTYTESSLRDTLSMVNQTPRHRIKKSRGALFIYLVKLYGQRIN